MESEETTEIVSASVGVERSTQQVKKEPYTIGDELASSSEVITTVETNTVPSSVSNDAHTISVSSLGNINSFDERHTIVQITTNPTAVNNDMALIKTDPTSEDELQNDENKALSSTATTPERPRKQTETLCAEETATSISDTIKTNTAKEEPSTSTDIPEDIFADLLLATDQMISEQMSPPNIKEENMSNQTAASAPPAINESISAQPRNEQSSNEVRGESGEVETEPEALPENFFDELLIPARVNIKNEHNDDVVGGGASVGVADAETEALPEDFFDDLLEDRVAKRIARLQNEDEEIKYAETLKNIKQKLRDLDESPETESSNKNKKHKHKKSKKKSHKRSRNRGDEEKDKGQDSVNARLDDDDSEGVQRKRKRNRSPITTSISNNNMNYDDMSKVAHTPTLTFNEEIYQTAAANFLAPEELPRSVATTSFAEVGASDELPGSSAAFSPFPLPYMVKADPSNFLPDANDDALDCLPVQQPSSSSAFNAFSGFKKIKLEMPLTQLNVKTEDILPLTPATKRQKALDHAAQTIKQLQSAQDNPNSSVFNFTSTVRKLPTSNSYVTQQIYDNRSPLHTINNVDYAFNSNSTRFNLHEWGLVAMPKLLAKVAKVIGCDADTLFSKLKANKNPNKFSKKVKREVGDGEAIDETKSSFFTNAMTQTDDVCIGAGRKRKGHDIGMQVMPSRASIDTQTTFAISNVTAANNDLPLMRLINQLNENQLLALNDFTELIREPASSTAADMYRLRQRMLEIYKCSQMASAMPALAPARTRSNVTGVHNPNSHYQNTTSGRAPTHVTAAHNQNPQYQNTAPVRAQAHVTGAHSVSPLYQNTAVVRGPANIAITPNVITHYQNNAQPVYNATPSSSTVPTQYLQRNPAVSVRNQIPVVLTHQHQPTALNHVYQRADPRINAAFPIQPRNTEYQTVPPANYEFSPDPNNPVSPPSDSGIKYYGRGGMRR